jgi:FlaA1/EpsC-like NDP-sugar epimerase
LITNFFMNKLSFLIEWINALLRLNENILIYGAGNFGKEICRLLTDNRHRVIGFVDRKADHVYQWNDCVGCCT